MNAYPIPAPESSIFLQNEENANVYTALCMRIAAVVAAVMWILNILDFFIVDDSLMNIAMPMGILFFLLPSLLIKVWKNRKWMLKYVIMVCFLSGICIMSTALTIQLVMAWACPVILSCHYYSPKIMHFTIAGALICMFAAVYVGLYYGVWDSNMMRSNAELVGAAVRSEFIRNATEEGDNILLRVFNFYYLPRAVILVVIYLIGLTLSQRTHRLLREQEADTREKERIGTELNVATQIQADMLPCIFPAFPGRTEFDIYATMSPAKEVGGDFYDFFLVDDDHLAIVIADVSGKGVPAALFMVIAKTLLKNAMQTGLSPKVALEKVNNQLCENNKAEMFVTVWLGLYEISTGHLQASNAGHEYPAIRHADGSFELYEDKHGFVVAGMENTRYREYEMDLEVGDTLFVYTDGIVEATNGSNELYGAERMLKALNEVKDSRPDELLDHVKSDIGRFVGSTPQFDDITMLAIHRKATGGENMQKIKIHPSLKALQEVYSFFDQVLSEHDVPSKTRNKVNIVADEIFSNIARYSGATSATIGCEVTEGKIVIRFSDNGRPYDPTTLEDPDITLSADDRAIGGLGVFLVKKSMDSVKYEYSDGLNVLTLESSW